MKEFIIGDQVIRSKGDYVVGRVGKIIEIDSLNGRARVEWEGNPRTWVKFDVIELASIPCEILTTSKYPVYRKK